MNNGNNDYTEELNNLENEEYIDINYSLDSGGNDSGEDSEDSEDGDETEDEKTLRKEEERQESLEKLEKSIESFFTPKSNDTLTNLNKMAQHKLWTTTLIRPDLFNDTESKTRISDFIKKKLEEQRNIIITTIDKKKAEKLKEEYKEDLNSLDNKYLLKCSDGEKFTKLYKFEANIIEQKVSTELEQKVNTELKKEDENTTKPISELDKFISASGRGIAEYKTQFMQLNSIYLGAKLQHNKGTMDKAAKFLKEYSPTDEDLKDLEKNARFKDNFNNLTENNSAVVVKSEKLAVVVKSEESNVEFPSKDLPNIRELIKDIKNFDLTTNFEKLADANTDIRNLLNANNKTNELQTPPLTGPLPKHPITKKTVEETLTRIEKYLEQLNIYKKTRETQEVIDNLNNSKRDLELLINKSSIPKPPPANTDPDLDLQNQQAKEAGENLENAKDTLNIQFANNQAEQSQEQQNLQTLAQNTQEIEIKEQIIINNETTSSNSQTESLQTLAQNTKEIEEKRKDLSYDDLKSMALNPFYTNDPKWKDLLKEVQKLEVKDNIIEENLNILAEIKSNTNKQMEAISPVDANFMAQVEQSKTKGSEIYNTDKNSLTPKEINFIKQFDEDLTKAIDLWSDTKRFVEELRKNVDNEKARYVCEDMENANNIKDILEKVSIFCKLEEDKAKNVRPVAQ